MNNPILALSAIDLRMLTAMNRYNRRRALSLFFGAVSRAGDGVFWYLLMASLPLLHGADGAAVSLRLLGAGVVAWLLYRTIKRLTRRARPCDAMPGLECTTAPLDRFSFPSGHTLHAVTFTAIVVPALPAWGYVLVPFTALVAASRVVLGLHYPSDVAAGLVLGLGLAELTRVVAPLG